MNKNYSHLDCVKHTSREVGGMPPPIPRKILKINALRLNLEVIF